MITKRKFIEIVEGLLAKARHDEVRWQQTSVGRFDEEYDTFEVQFNESKLYVQYSSPAAEPDEIEVGIENHEGDTIKRVVALEDDADPVWLLFFDLYQEANRSVTDSDRVLGEIEAELQKRGAIGRS